MEAGTDAGTEAARNAGCVRDAYGMRTGRAQAGGMRMGHAHWDAQWDARKMAVGWAWDAQGENGTYAGRKHKNPLGCASGCVLGCVQLSVGMRALPPSEYEFETK